MPRLSFNHVYMMPGPPELRWDRLEGASAMHFSEPQRIALHDSMFRYLHVLAGQRATAHTKDVKRHLARIHKHAGTLISLLTVHLKIDPSDTDQMNLEQAAFEMLPTDFDREGHIRQLITLRHAAQSALIRIRKEGQPGRSDSEALDVMIREWHVVYQQAGGEGLGCSRSGSSSTAQGAFLAILFEAFQLQKDRVPKKYLHANRHALAQKILHTLKALTARDKN